VPKPSNIDDSVKKELAAAVDETGRLLSSNEIDKSLRRILKYSSYMNHYFQTNSPWSNKDTSNTTVYISVNAVRSLAILLEPFIPFSCEKIWAQLKFGGGSVHQQMWESAKDIRAIPTGHELGKIEPIFRKIEAKEIEQWKNKLGKPQ
jgi:methionyl-tRNA synthetase